MTMEHGEDLHGASFDGFTVEVDEEQQRGDIILDRGEMNTISMGQREELRAAFENLDRDERVRVIVLRALGPNFSSGGFIRGFMEASPEHVSKLADNIAAPTRCEKPTIAAGRGYCFGVGFEVSLACDFRIASETTLYALPEQRLGQIPGSGGSARLQKMIGITRTKHIVMRSKRIGGNRPMSGASSPRSLQMRNSKAPRTPSWRSFVSSPRSLSERPSAYSTRRKTPSCP